MNDTEKTINNFLQQKGITFSCTYAGTGKPFGDYEMDSWKCAFSSNGKSASFDFYTGISYRKIKKGAVRSKNNMLPSAPCAVSVLYSLIRDSEAREMCFQDWADELGYSADSIKALNMYNECYDNAIKLHNVFGRENIAILEDMLQDY